jgi:hypothetical protein
VIGTWLRWRVLLTRTRFGRVVRPCRTCGRAWTLRTGDVRMLAGRVVIPQRCRGLSAATRGASGHADLSPLVRS